MECVQCARGHMDLDSCALHTSHTWSCKCRKLPDTTARLLLDHILSPCDIDTLGEGHLYTKGHRSKLHGVSDTSTSYTWC